MKKTTLYRYYAFGHNYQIIKQDGLQGRSNSEAKKQIEEFLEELDALNLPVTKRVSSGLRRIAKAMPRVSAAIDNEVAKEVVNEMGKIDPSLDAELELKEAFMLTEKRFSLEYLTNQPEKLLGVDVFHQLPDNAKRDFSLACRSVALSQPTAAAFHLMRAAEEQVKQMYYTFKKTGRLKNPMWGPMVKELRHKRRPKPAEKTLDTLDSIRVHFRNPTQHPESFYTLDEAQDLLNQTITAINMICREIQGK